jgi:C1A family cysteine protease
MMEYGPVVVAISSVGWNTYSSGVFGCGPDDPVDHAVLAVGWTEDAWIIKNQWSDRWGDDGYIYLSMEEGKNCRMGKSVHSMWEAHFIPILFIALLAFLI